MTNETLPPGTWDSPKNILVILAHPDDPEFFCGATLAKWARAGHHITYVLLTCGDKGFNPTTHPEMTPDKLCAIRHEEQYAAAKVIGAEAVHIMDHPDGRCDPQGKGPSGAANQPRRPLCPHGLPCGPLGRTHVRPHPARTDPARDPRYSKAIRLRSAPGKGCGFDLVELHGGTGYLLAQFISPRTNKRSDGYGGALENRMRFPLETLKRVQDAVGGFPVGYRFLAHEWLPDGLEPAESVEFACALSENGIAYLSVMGGTYESFFLPEIVRNSKKPGFMVPLAQAVKKHVRVPVIAAGRISSPKLADSIIDKGKADLIGLARMLWADPLWALKKARRGRARDIVKCSSRCSARMELVLKGQAAFCTRWDRVTRQEYKALSTTRASPPLFWR